MIQSSASLSVEATPEATTGQNKLEALVILSDFHRKTALARKTFFTQPEALPQRLATMLRCTSGHMQTTSQVSSVSVSMIGNQTPSFKVDLALIVLVLGSNAY